MIRLLIALECVLLLIIVVDGATSKTADDRRVAEEKATQPQRNAETAFVAGGPVPALPARDPSPVTPHDLGPGGGIGEHDRAAIARNLLSPAELPRPLEASVAAPLERGEGEAVDESAARPAEPSTAVTTGGEAGLQFGQAGTPGHLAAGRYSGSGAADHAALRLTEASDSALDRSTAATMPPAPSPAPTVPSARPNRSEQVSLGRIAEAQRLLTRLG
jgi:hypothetical protein